jgi:elastase-2
MLLSAEARPSPDILQASVDVDLAIIDGTDALPEAWPWQLSLQKLFSSSWTHGCGAILLSSKYALTAAHCVDGM